jgi:transcriptional regulator with XRE-family HTH domain
MPDFGSSLTRLRQGQRLSQLQLALRAGLSQRHISFIESGRARPGPVAIGKLVAGLGLSRAEAARLIQSLHPEQAEATPDWLSPELAPARSVATQLLDRHDPYPALICLRDGAVLQSNAGFVHLLTVAAPDGSLTQHADNLYDLTLHPDALPRFMDNPKAIIPHTVARLRRIADQHDDARATLSRVSRYDTVKAHAGFQTETAATGVLCERYRIGDQTIGLVTMSAAFGCPEQELAQHVSVELFFPADEATAGVIQMLTGVRR